MFRNRIRQYDLPRATPQAMPAFAPIFSCGTMGLGMIQVWASVYEVARQQAMQELAYQKVDEFLRNFSSN